MAESVSEFWRKLAGEFRSINCFETSFTWALFSPTDLELTVNFTDDDTGRSTKAQFEALCLEAGLKLEPHSGNPLFLWLAALKHESPNDMPGQGRGSRDGVLLEYRTGRINNPCLASANLCHILQTRAKKAEQELTKASATVLSEQAQRKQFFDAGMADLDAEVEREAQKHVRIEKRIRELMPPEAEEVIDSVEIVEDDGILTPRADLAENRASLPEYSETIAMQIDRLRSDCRMTVEELAESIEINARSVYRHLAGTAPRSKQIRAYERLFSERLERKVVLSQTSGKRQ